jgi:hypothetical protein
VLLAVWHASVSANLDSLARVTERAVPILPSRDLLETLAFYERLGFENRGTPPEEWDYMILRQNGSCVRSYASRDARPTMAWFDQLEEEGADAGQ